MRDLWDRWYIRVEGWVEVAAWVLSEIEADDVEAEVWR